MDNDQWRLFLDSRFPNETWQRYYGRTPTAIYSVVVIAGSESDSSEGVVQNAVKEISQFCVTPEEWTAAYFVALHAQSQRRMFFLCVNLLLGIHLPAKSGYQFAQEIPDAAKYDDGSWTDIVFCPERMVARLPLHVASANFSQYAMATHATLAVSFLKKKVPNYDCRWIEEAIDGNGLHSRLFQ